MGWIILAIMIATGIIGIWAIIKIDDVIYMRRLNRNWMAVIKRMEEEDKRIIKESVKL